MSKSLNLRLYADFNSGGTPGHGPCWLLRYGPDMKLLDEVAEELGLTSGMPVTLYYEDPSEEFEVSAVLQRSDHNGKKWLATPDWSTFRRLR
jgi:hypothetical protein